MANDGSVEIKIIGDDSDLKKKLGGIGAAAQKAAGTIEKAFQAVASFDKLVKGIQEASCAVELFNMRQSASAVQSGVTAGALTAQEAIVGVLTGQIGLATAAQAAWNTVIAANPVGAVVVAVTLLTTGLAALYAATDTETQAEKAAREEREKLIRSIDDRTEATKELQSAAQDQLNASLSEIDITAAQVREFEGLIDANGRVKSGYEGRAAVLEKLINEAIPGAISKTEDETGTYYELSDAIEETIRLKRAQSVLDANQEQYSAAQAGIIDAEKERYQIQQKRNDALVKQRQIESEIEAFKSSSTFNEADYEQMKLALEEQKKLVSDLSGKYAEADSTVSDYYKTIANYEGVLAAMEQGGDALEQALNKVQYSFKTAGTATVGELQAQADELGGIYQDMLARYRSGESDITEAQVNNMRAMWESAGTELKTAQENLMTEWSASIAAGQPQVDAAVQLVAQGVVSAADVTAQMQEKGYTVTAEFASGIAAAEALASGNAAQVEAMCEAALDGDTTTYGYDFMQGFLEAILASNPSEEVRAMVQAALDAIPETQQSHSPSALTMEQGGYFAEGYAEGIANGAGAAETAAGSMAGQAIAKLLGIAPQAQEGGAQAATQYSTGMRSGMAGAVEAAILLATGASGAAKGKAGEFSTVGGELSASLKSGIDGGAQAVSTAMDTVAAGAKASAAKVASTFRAVGVNMAQGLMNGISSMARSVANAAASLAKNALDAAKNAVGIHSPSRDFREKVGRMMGMGMALGIGDSEDTVRSNVALLSRHALEDAREHAKSFQDIGGLYVENLTYGVEKGRDAALDKLERWLDADVEKLGARDDATDEQKKSYEDAAREVMTAYKDALNDGYDEALSTVKTRVNELTAEFQAAHDDLVRQQESMQKKLSGFGDLFTIGKNGDLSLGKIEDNIKAVKRYDDALTELAGLGVSDEFMQQVTALGVEEGAKFAEKLIALPPEALKQYTDAWQEQQDLAKEVAEKFYADQLETLENDFTGKLDETLESVPDLLTAIGKDSIQGMIDGMYSKRGALSAAAREIVSQAISAMRRAADVNSPSKKTRDLVGRPLAEGVAVGFDKQMGDVYRQISRTLDGEVLKLSADVRVQAERQAAKAGPAPVQTVYKTTHTVATPVIEFKGELAQLGRLLTPVVRMEEKRKGGSMAKGGVYA